MAKTMASELETVTIDGKHYQLGDFSEEAKQSLNNLRYADQQIVLLSNKQALAETAKTFYTKALTTLIPEKKAAANKKKDIITIDGERYNLSDFSDEGQAQLRNISFAEQELSRLQGEKALANTARAAYAALVAEALKNIEPVKAQ